MGFHMKITLNRTDRRNKYTHAQAIYVKSIYRLLKLRRSTPLAGNADETSSVYIYLWS